MSDFDFRDSLAQVEHTYTRENIEPWLSFDGQLYVQCKHCDRALWTNPLYIEDGSLDNEKCDRCGDTQLELKRFAHLLVALCSRCYTQNSFDSRSPSPCINCGGQSFSVTNVHPKPEMPSMFGTAFEKKEIDWCVDVGDDINFINRTLASFRSGTGFHAICLHFELFFKSLFARGKYEATPSLRAELLNAPAQILRQVFRETGDIETGLGSIDLMKEATEKAEDELTRGLYTHNIATNIHSMLCKGLEPVINATRQCDIRSEALKASAKALSLYERCAGLEPNQRSQKCAEVEWLHGDILSAGNATDDLILQSAEWYDRALSRPDLDERLLNNIRASRRERLAKMSSPPNDLLDNFFDGSSNPEPFSGDPSAVIQDLAAKGIAAFTDCQLEESLEHFCEAYGIVRGQLATSARDTVIRNYGTQFMGVALRLAQVLAKSEMVTAAIAVIEDFRSFAIWEKSTADAVAKKCAKIGATSALSKILGGSGNIPFDQAGLKESIEEATAMFQTIFAAAAPPELVLMLNVGHGHVFSIACYVDGDTLITDMLEDIENSELSQLSQPMLALRMADQPSILRAERVRRLISSAKSVFDLRLPSSFQTAASVLIVSSFTSIPFESFSLGGDTKQVVTYSPSLRIAAGMAEGWNDRVIRKVLIVGYGGTDLPAAHKEAEVIESLFGKRAEVLDKKQANRAEVLNRLENGAYDVIHFACHGTFDGTDPLNSSLHLGGSERLSARDLLALDELRGRPIICLSACSSAIVSLNSSSNCLGLIGAFFRIGVSGLLGTRWPVKDRLALDYCRVFYEQLASGHSPRDSLMAAQQAITNAHPVDDANSFIYFGC